MLTPKIYQTHKGEGMKKNVYLALTLLPMLFASLSAETRTATRARAYEDVSDNYDDDGYDIADNEGDDDYVSASDSTAITPSNATNRMMEDNDYPGLNRPNMVYAGQPFPSQSANLSIFGDFLYVSSNVNDLVYAAFESTGATTYYDYKTFDRHYTPAFRIGADYSLSAQGWTFGADWTRVNQENSETKYYPYSKGEAVVIYTPDSSEPYGANEAGGSVYGKQSLSFNEVNVTLGKEIFFSKYFSFRPTASGTFLWYTHEFHNNFSNINGYEYNDIKFKNEFYGFGFKFGGSPRFQLSYGFYILGDAQLGIICGPRDVYQYSTDDTFMNTNSHLHSTIFLPMLEAKMDLGWRRSFAKDQFGLDIYAGYEYHNYFNAMQMLQRGVYDVGNTVTNQINHDLGIQGLNVGLRFSF
jgi:hypothetical protein